MEEWLISADRARARGVANALQTRRDATRRRGKKAPGDSINSYYALFVPFLAALLLQFFFSFLFLPRQSMLWKFSLEGKKHARRGVEDEKRWIKAAMV